MLKHRVIIGQDNHEINIPQSWEEVTWGQFKKICGKEFKNTDVEITEILTGHPFKGFWSKFREMDNWTRIKLDCMRAVQDKPDMENYPLYDIITYQDKDHLIAKDLGHEEVGWFEEAKIHVTAWQNAITAQENPELELENWKDQHREELTDMSKEEVEAYAKASFTPTKIDIDFVNGITESIFKIYFYEMFTGEELDSEKAAAMDIDSLRCMDVKKWGDFFLMNINASLIGITLKLHQPTIVRKKSRRGIVRFLMTLGFIQSYGRWQKATC